MSDPTTEPIPEQVTQDVSEMNDEAEDDQIAHLKAKMEEIEKEAAKLRDMQDDLNRGQAPGEGESSDGRELIDSRSVYVGNVDYSTTPEELQRYFADCGNVNRVTILTNKITGNPKGFAYVEFDDVSAVEKAVELNETSFKDRTLKVVPKRTNYHSFNRGRGGPMRGRGGMIRGRGRGGSRGTRFRGARGRGRFVPY